MSDAEKYTIKELIDRIARINAADEWIEDINPTQWTALSYLARANKFSRSPSQVSDFMSATRGTVSQTLKTLARKGLISKVRSDQDKRSISYSITEAGISIVQKNTMLKDSLSTWSEEDLSSFRSAMEKLVRSTLKQRGLRAFGVCKTCKHHQGSNQGAYCTLLNEPLTAPETKQICYEHAQTS